MREVSQYLVIFAAITVICGSILYGCSSASNSYYKLADNCVNSGGSWIPHSGPGTYYSGMCITPGNKVITQ